MPLSTRVQMLLVRGGAELWHAGMPRQVAADSVQFDLVLSMAEEGDTLRGQLIFTADLFTRATAKRMAGHYTVRARRAGLRSLAGSTGLPRVRNTVVVIRIDPNGLLNGCRLFWRALWLPQTRRSCAST
jgi:hypothetical protein